MEKLLTHEEAVIEAEALLRSAGLDSVNIRFGTDGAHIENSYLVREKRLRLDVCRVLERTEGFTRPAARMSSEWLGHNIFYRLTRHPGAASADIEFEDDKRLVVRMGERIMDLMGLH